MSVSGGMMEGVEQIDQPGTLTEQTVRRLHRAILAGELAPGRRYSTAAIAGQLGVSRTPVREAALQLERMGLVAIERNRGIRILTTSVEQLLQGYELRLMLELPLVERAVGQATDTERAEVDRVHEAFRQAAARGDDEGTLRCDRDYHMALLRGAHNGRALRVLEELRTMVLVSGVGTVPTSRSAQECFDDHADVHVAWLRRDAAGVREALGRHIVHTASILIRQESRVGRTSPKTSTCMSGWAGCCAERVRCEARAGAAAVPVRDAGDRRRCRGCGRAVTAGAIDGHGVHTATSSSADSSARGMWGRRHRRRSRESEPTASCMQHAIGVVCACAVSGMRRRASRDGAQDLIHSN